MMTRTYSVILVNKLKPNRDVEAAQTNEQHMGMTDDVNILLSRIQQDDDQGIVMMGNIKSCY